MDIPMLKTTEDSLVWCNYDVDDDDDDDDDDAGFSLFGFVGMVTEKRIELMDTARWVELRLDTYSSN